MGGEVVQDDVDRGAVGAGGADRFQRGQAVAGAFAAAVDASQPVVADGVAAVEVGHAVGTAEGRREPVGLALLRPAGARGGRDPQRPGLVEGEDLTRRTPPPVPPLRTQAPTLPCLRRQSQPPSSATADAPSETASWLEVRLGTRGVHGCRPGALLGGPYRWRRRATAAGRPGWECVLERAVLP